MKTILDLITCLDTEDERIDVVDYETEELEFSFWSGSYFSEDLDSHQNRVIETYRLRGFHIETPEELNPRLVCSVEKPSVDTGEIRKIMDNIYGGELT